MNVDQVTRFARHLALPEIGAAGQRALLDATVVVISGADGAGGLFAETAVRYLTAAGVGRVRAIAPARDWDAVLRGTTVVLRSGFEDDALLEEARARGIPVIVARTGGETDESSFDLLSFRHPAQADARDVPAAPARDQPGEALSGSSPPAGPRAATQVFAGTVAAAEALWRIIEIGRRGEQPGARHVQIDFSAGAVLSQDIPWPP